MDSQEQQALYSLLQRESCPSLVLEEFTRYVDQGKDLSWFQDVVPELIPGVEGNISWLEEARSMLWSDDIQAQHKAMCEKDHLLERTLPEIPKDEYRLWKYWRVVVESLQPASLTTAMAVDNVSAELGRTDCLLLNPDKTWMTTSTEDKPPQQDYIAILQLVQDKVLCPLIKSIHLRRQEMEEQATDSERDSRILRQVQTQQGRAQSLEEALDNLRSVIIEEKDRLAFATARKRPNDSSSSPENAARAKRLERG